ncbi:MAG: hypothetical protein J6A73_04690 [Lachnospiraceae bacterium]|nr:hypothetical protein [Lachnospiraceae bacterium]
MLTVSEIIKSVDSDEKLFERVEDCLNGVKLHFVKLGYLLRILKERGYDNAFLHDRFGISKSTINRCIQINEQFSEDGYSFKIAEKYADFSKSQLVEMLPLSEDQRENVTPDMSIADIRDLKNQEEEEDDIDEIESAPEDAVELPEYDPNKNREGIQAAIAKALSEIPEVGRDVNKMIKYICDSKNPPLYFVVDDINFFVKFNGGYYLYLESDEVKICCYFYIYVNNFASYPEVLEYSDVAHYPKIQNYMVINKLGKYCAEHWNDWDYIREHFDNISMALVDDLPLEFELENEYLVKYSNKGYYLSYLHYQDSDDVFVPFKDLERSILSSFYSKLQDLFLRALSDNVRKCKHIYSYDKGDLFVCDADKHLAFIFELQCNGTIELCFGLHGRDFNGFLMEEVEFEDYFSVWDDTVINIFFLLCTDKEVQGAINAYWKSENAEK